MTIDPATAQGWTKNDDGQYFYYKDGKALTGWQTIGGKQYFFDIIGAMQTGCYYLSAKGALVGWNNFGTKIITSQRRTSWYLESGL
ncbi:MAG: hypothetical protein WCD89_12810 [Anaerocolumna sp.]